MPKEPVDLALESYGRSCEAPEFFAAFYAHLFEACPATIYKFAHTDFDRQHRLLRHGIGLLLNFDRQSGDAPNILARVAERHARTDLDVDPAFYPFFVASLVATARKFDPQFDADTESAWRVATANGLAYMTSKY